MTFKPYNLETRVAISKLKKLRNKLCLETPKYRIEFLLTVFKAGLFREIISHELHDHGVSARDFDTCCEMGDGDVVVHGVMKEAINCPILRDAISSMGESTWNHWHQTYLKLEQELNKQVALF